MVGLFMMAKTPNTIKDILRIIGNMGKARKYIVMVRWKREIFRMMCLK